MTSSYLLSPRTTDPRVGLRGEWSSWGVVILSTQLSVSSEEVGSGWVRSGCPSLRGPVPPYPSIPGTRTEHADQFVRSLEKTTHTSSPQGPCRCECGTDGVRPFPPKTRLRPRSDTPKFRTKVVKDLFTGTCSMN